MEFGIIFAANSYLGVLGASAVSFLLQRSRARKYARWKICSSLIGAGASEAGREPGIRCGVQPRCR
jgi:hypothetical protein